MKKFNVKLFATLYTLDKIITARLNDMKKDLIDGATKTFENYAIVKVVDCKKASYTKEQQEELDNYAKMRGFQKQVTNYKRVEIDCINAQALETTMQMIETLEDSEDKAVQKVASKIAK